MISLQFVVRGSQLQIEHVLTSIAKHLSMNSPVHGINSQLFFGCVGYELTIIELLRKAVKFLGKAFLLWRIPIFLSSNSVVFKVKLKPYNA